MSGRLSFHAARRVSVPRAGRRAILRNMTDTQGEAPAGAPVLYTVPETCAMLKVSRTTLWRLTHTTRELYAVRVGRSVRYPHEAVAAYLRGERFDPTGGEPETRADVSTWPPTPSLLDPRTTA